MDAVGNRGVCCGVGVETGTQNHSGGDRLIAWRWVLKDSTPHPQPTPILLPAFVPLGPTSMGFGRLDLFGAHREMTRTLKPKN